MTDAVLIEELENGVLTLTFNRPKKKNAFNSEAWLALHDVLNAARDNDEVACVLMRGAGNDFSSGMDLNDFAGEGFEGEPPFYKAQRAVVDFDKPLIAAAKGIAIGGGATLLFHCDIVYVGDSLRMRLPFVSLGLVPEFAASYTLQQNIGLRQANELFYTAEWINADRAVEVGIATRQYQDDELFAVAAEKAAEIAQWPVVSLQQTKRCLKLPHREAIEAVLVAEKAGMDMLAGGPANMEAVMAIFEKREPNFKDIKS